MEITMGFLKSLKSDDLRRIEVYQKFLKEAEEAVKLVIEKYKFSIFEEKITLWNDGNNAEYLTHNGVWQARYLHQTYDINITVDEVFDVFKEEYELKNNGRVNNKAESASYFRAFISNIKED